MAYQPSAEDFEDINDGEGYTPSAEDFQDEQSPSSHPLELELTKSFHPKKTGWKAVGEDAIEMLRNALHSGAGFARRLPGNLKEFGSELIHHPLSYPPHVAQQVLAGLGEGGKALANIPHNIFDELANREITPDWLRTGEIPEDIGVEKFLGLQPTKRSDELLRALPAIYGGGKLTGKGVSKVTKAVGAPDLKQALRDTQAKVNEANSKAGKIFEHVEQEFDARNIPKIPIDSKLINEARELLSKTLANKRLINEAKKGDYKALRKLQGDLRNKGEKGLASDELANNDLGEKMFEVRDEINSSIQKHLENQGHEDLADALNKVRKDYRKIKQTYHSTTKLSKTFGENQFVPHNPITFLREESTQMKRFMEAHPELEKALAKAMKHDKKMKIIKNSGLILGGGSVGGAAGIGAYNYFGGH